MCHVTPHCSRVLSTILLGLRIHLRLDTNASPAEFVYGTTLRVPGELVLLEDFSPNPQVFVEEFRQYMREVKPVPVEHHHKKKRLSSSKTYTLDHTSSSASVVSRSPSGVCIPVHIG
ncbi:hypothetical protein WN55_05530 [Dufourea novaeangliae]|uniref:Uncharacterized protein n=1 Tax=Dufourea novaeangliae TaxID=178035 RepID=A0A154PMZ8_DUFNO|nr:hypothetical protein WN55_05530 [Dufourea novaeangliae]